MEGTPIYLARASITPWQRWKRRSRRAEVRMLVRIHCVVEAAGIEPETVRARLSTAIVEWMLSNQNAKDLLAGHYRPRTQGPWVNCE